QALAQRLPGEDGKRGEIVEAADILGNDAGGLQELAVVTDVRVGMLEEPPQAFQLQLADLLGREPLRPLELAQVLARVVRAARVGKTDGWPCRPRPVLCRAEGQRKTLVLRLP